jgi:hypothetical protein
MSLFYSFIFSNLENGDQLMTSATISLCFESSSPCDLQTTLLDGLIFPKQICKWDKGFALNGIHFYCLHREKRNYLIIIIIGQFLKYMRSPINTII